MLLSTGAVAERAQAAQGPPHHGLPSCGFRHALQALGVGRCLSLLVTA